MKTTNLLCLLPLWAALPLCAQQPFFAEDFSGPQLPPGWTTDDLSGNAPEQLVTWQPCSDEQECSPRFFDYFAEQFDGAGLGFQTAFNGYLVAHSFSAGLTLADDPHIAILQMPVLDCSDRDVVVLTFESHLGVATSAAFEDARIQVSADGINWTDFLAYPDLGLSALTTRFTPNPHPVWVDISSVAAGQPEVYIRWWWRGYSEWAWAIDDVEVYDYQPYYYRAVWGQQPGQGDFAGGLNGWSAVNIIPFNKGWKWEANGYVGNALSAPDAFYLGSPTWHNGAAVLNADFLTTGGQDPPLPPFPVYLSELVSPVMDLSATQGQLSMRYWQMARLIGQASSAPYHTAWAYSLDAGATWSDWFDANPGLGINTPWITERRIIQLPDTLIGQADARIKFLFAGNFYAWALDDLVIFEREEYNLEMKDNFYAFPIDAQTPVAVLEPLRFLCDVFNGGQLTQSDVWAHIRIFREEEIVFHDSLSLGEMAPGLLLENLIFEKAFSAPQEPAAYRGQYFVRGEQSDQFPDNDTLTWTWEVNAGIWAKETGPTAAFAPQFQTSYSYGNAYYVPPGATLEVCSLAFGIGNADQLAGKKLTALVYAWPEGDVNGDLAATPDEHELIASNEYTITGDEPGQLITIPLQSNAAALPLMGGSHYFAVVRYESENNQPCFLLASEARDYQATYFLYDSLQTPRYCTMLDLGNTDVFSVIGLGQSGFDQTPVMRLQTCTGGVSVKENLDASGLLTLYPNPASGALWIQWEGKAWEEWRIYDQNGILAARGKSGQNPDISNLKSGFYWLTLHDLTGRLLNRQTFVKL